MFQHLAASVNSVATSCPLGNRPRAPLFNNGYASVSNFGSGARARAVTTSMRLGARFTKSAIRTAWTSAGTPAARTASRRKFAFLPMLSTRWTSTPFCSASAQAITSPGKPAPEPRSTQICEPGRDFGASNRSCRESAMCRVHNSLFGRRRDQIGVLLPLQEHFDEAVEAGQMFHVKQGSAPAPDLGLRRALAAKRGIAPVRRPWSARIFRESRHPHDRGALITPHRGSACYWACDSAAVHAPPTASGLPASCRRFCRPGRWSAAVGLQLVADLIRKPWQRAIVEVIVENEALIAAIGFHIRSLAAQIDLVLGVDFELLGDLGRKVSEFRPDPRQISR